MMKMAFNGGGGWGLVRALDGGGGVQWRWWHSMAVTTNDGKVVVRWRG
jgi:hypothetical protein